MKITYPSLAQIVSYDGREKLGTTAQSWGGKRKDFHGREEGKKQWGFGEEEDFL